MAFLAISVMGCKKEKLITLSETSTTLHHGETYQISAQCENPITYSSANEYYAKVSSSGVITAQYVGRTTIALKSEEDAKTFTVTVAPKSNLYPEPNIRFGETKNSIISKFGTPDSSTDTSVGYIDYSTNAPGLLVMFDENDCVNDYAVIVKTAYSSELGTFLSERYYFIGYSDGLSAYMNALTTTSATMLVGSKLYNVSYWITLYMPNDGRRREIDDIDMMALLKTLE
ncbi:MAG: Ig-like domain-containing protein [Bacteroidales bacterium]|nr:Ig-like domain-containing protein [Bacteroidales bacterium]